MTDQSTSTITSRMPSHQPDSPLLYPSNTTQIDYGAVSDSSSYGEDYEEPHRRQIGVFSAMFIIFNRMIGTGVFATPSMILSLSGSVGMSLVMWVIGALIAAAGMQVYLIWGTALPYNGGEKNYLEHLFPRPKWLVTSMYAANAVLMAHSAGNALVFAEYFLISVSPCGTSPPSTPCIPPSPAPIAALVLTFVLFLHGLHLPAGLRLQNILGVLKIGVLLAVVYTGLAAHMGVFQPGVERPKNLESWDTVWKGTKLGASSVCLGLYNVIYCFAGFSNANYALSEMHRPSRTLGLAGPFALILVTIIYLAANMAYLSGVAAEEITGSGRLVAALLVRNVWGEEMERVLAAGVALSALGNVLSVAFSQGRVNQALGKERVLPFSSVWASNWPRNAPLAGLTIHWCMCLVVVFAVPPGDAYNFVINVTSYPLTIINATISFGLIYLSLYPRGTTRSSSDSPDPASSQSFLHNPTPTPSHIIPALFFGLANVFLVSVPLLKPPSEAEPYVHLPYWTHAAAGWLLLLVGAFWWVVGVRGQAELPQAKSLPFE